MKPCKIVDHQEADDRVREIGLTREGLIRTGQRAIAFGNIATDNSACNAAGSLRYHEGITALRDEFRGKDWLKDRQEGVELIRHRETSVKIGFKGVHKAGVVKIEPQPVSKFGPGSERAIDNAMPTFPDFLDIDKDAKLAGPKSGIYSFYHLMVSDDGGMELSAIRSVKDDNNLDYDERIMLRVPEDDELVIVDDSNEDDGPDHFDVVITRRP